MPWQVDSAASALASAKTASTRREIQYSRHARERMEERQAFEPDVNEALQNAYSATQDPENPCKWTFVGSDVDGDELHIVVAFDRPDPLVVTVW